MDISDFPTRHNYWLGLWQNHIERILAGWVGELAVTIYRGREVTGFAQSESGVDVKLSDGQSLRAEYLVGCDGGRSLIRKAASWQESDDLDMMFQGTYTSDFYRAVRNLLHDQIALQTADVPLLPEHERATDAIEHRWQELSKNELKYRSPSQKSAATA